MSILNSMPKIKLERKGEVRNKVAIGTAIGLTVGAVAGVLLAPKSGKENREDLVKTIDELPNKAKELSAKAHKMVGEAAGKISEETHKIMCEQKETLDGVYDSVHSEMNEAILKGQWHELKGGIKAKWGKLTDDDLTTVDGQFEKLMGILQTKYGYSKEKVREEYDNLINATRQKISMK